VLERFGRAAFLVNTFEQVSRFNLQSTGEFNDICDTCILLPALDAANVVRMEPRQLCETLLREFTFEPESFDVLTEQNVGLHWSERTFACFSPKSQDTIGFQHDWV
jgi:hypothetical protein